MWPSRVGLPAALTLSVEEFRQRELRRRTAGIETLAVLARHRPTKMLAGLHDLTIPADGTVANVQNTGVTEAHRGHGIGRWLKASMVLWLADEDPPVARFITATSDVNHHMRRINEDLGYQLELERTVWQVRLRTLRERLCSSPN